MELTADEALLAHYLNKWCPTADETGAITVGMAWGGTNGAIDAHTGKLKAEFGGDWARFGRAASSLRDKGVIGLTESEVAWRLWPTVAGQSAVTPVTAGENPPGAVWERIAAVAAAFVVLGLVVFLAVRNEPFRDLTIAAMIRIVLSLAVAIFGATVPGFLNVEWLDGRWAVRAGGALALFVICYFGTPKVFPAIEPTPEIRTGDAIDGNRVIPVGREVAVWLVDVPDKATVAWSRPARGTINAAEGGGVRYTATDPGDERLVAEVKTAWGEVFRPEIAFRVVASLDNLPAVQAGDEGDRAPNGPPSRILVRGGVRNPLAAPVRIHSVGLAIDRAATDLTFRPTVEMFPFLDYLVVKPVDRGWGEAPEANLALFHEVEFGPGDGPPAADIAKILGVGTGSLKLDGSSWGRYHFLPQRADAQPFELIASKRAPTAVGAEGAAWRPRAFELVPVVEATNAAVTVHEVVRRGPAAGVVARATGLIRTDTGGTPCDYRTRSFQPSPAPAHAWAWLGRLLGSDQFGGMSEGFAIGTGDVTAVPVQKMVATSTMFFGAAIHLRDGSHRDFQVPVACDLGPGGEFKYELGLSAAKSLAVSGVVFVRYQVGDGPVVHHAAGRFDGATTVPRPDAAGWEATEQFLRALRAHDRSVGERAANAIARAALPTRTAAERSQAIRRCGDAILVLMTGPDAAAHRPSVLEFLASGPGKGVLREIFPAVCAYLPDAAVSAAVAALNESPELIVECACRPETAARLAASREAIGKAIAGGAMLHTLKGSLAVALAAGLPETAWAESPDAPWDDEWAIAAWSLARSPNPRLEAEVRRRLTDRAGEPRVAAKVIDGLAASGNGRFRHEVAAVVERTANSSTRSLADYQSLVASLKYLARVRSPKGLRPLLTSLETYPYDPLVRDLAKDILRRADAD